MDIEEEYYRTFGEGFPLMEWGGSTEEAFEEMRRCIDAGEPYAPEDDGDVLY